MRAAQCEHGGKGCMYIEHPRRTSLVVALRIAFSSAWIVQSFFNSLSLRISSLSSTPRGRPLNPVETMVLSELTMTAPTCEEGSLLQVEINSATSMNLASHLPSMPQLCFKGSKCQTKRGIVAAQCATARESPSASTEAPPEPEKPRPENETCLKPLTRNETPPRLKPDEQTR